MKVAKHARNPNSFFPEGASGADGPLALICSKMMLAKLPAQLAASGLASDKADSSADTLSMANASHVFPLQHQAGSIKNDPPLADLVAGAAKKPTFQGTCSHFTGLSLRVAGSNSEVTPPLKQWLKEGAVRGKNSWQQWRMPPFLQVPYCQL